MSIAKNVEVYTKKGWTPISSCPETTEIYGMNKNKEGSFKEIASVEQVWQDTMTHIYNKKGSFDTCLSEDHECLTCQSGEITNYRIPGEFNTNTRFIRAVNNIQESPKTFNVNGIEFDIEDYVFICSWYISEGSIYHDCSYAKSKGYPVRITQTEKGCYDYLKENLERIANKYDLNFWYGTKELRISDKRLHDYFLPMGYSHEKYLPEIMFNLSNKHINEFLEYYIMGDGHDSGAQKEIYTNSPQLVSGISGLIGLSGSYPGVYLKMKKGTPVVIDGVKSVCNHDLFGITVNKNKYAGNESCIHDVIEYNDYAFDVDSSHDAVWIRYNGKTCFI